MKTISGNVANRIRAPCRHRTSVALTPTVRPAALSGAGNKRIYVLRRQTSQKAGTPAALPPPALLAALLAALLTAVVVIATMPGVAAAEEKKSEGSHDGNEPESTEVSANADEALIEAADAEIRVVSGCISILDGDGERLVVGDGCQEESPGTENIVPPTEEDVSEEDVSENSDGEDTTGAPAPEATNSELTADEPSAAADVTEEDSPREVLDALLTECASRQTDAQVHEGDGSDRKEKDDEQLSEEDCDALLTALGDETAAADQTVAQKSTSEPTTRSAEHAGTENTPSSDDKRESITGDVTPGEAATSEADAAESTASEPTVDGNADGETTEPPAEDTQQGTAAMPGDSHNDGAAAPEDSKEGGVEENPFEGEQMYVDPDSEAARQADELESSEPDKADALEEIAETPQADWFSSSSVEGVREEVDARVTEVAESGALPVLVAYNVPSRDCNGASGGGAANPVEYADWIRSFDEGIGDREAVVVLEPDALALIDCLSEEEQQEREQLIKDATDTLADSPNVSVYVDAGHSEMAEPEQMADRLQQAGVEEARGFATNVSNFQGTEEEVAYGEELSKELDGKPFVVDTGRNGSGPGNKGEWCNPEGRALGERPTTATGADSADAYLWIKRPGESDGNCEGGPPAGDWWTEYALDLADQAPDRGEAANAQATEDLAPETTTPLADDSSAATGITAVESTTEAASNDNPENDAHPQSTEQAAAEQTTLTDEGDDVSPDKTIPEEQTTSGAGAGPGAAGPSASDATVPAQDPASSENADNQQADERPGLLGRVFGNDNNAEGDGSQPSSTTENGYEATGETPEQEASTPVAPESTKEQDPAKEAEPAATEEENGPLEKVYFSVFGVFGAGEDEGDSSEPAEQQTADVSREQLDSGEVTGASPDTEDPGAGAAAGPGLETSQQKSEEPASEDSAKDDEDDSAFDKVMNIFGFVSIGSEDFSSESGS